MYMDIVHRRGSVSQIGYHIVFCTKYRKKLLDDRLSEDLRKIFTGIAKEKGFEIKQQETNIDHVHLFVSAPPNVSISTLVKWIKGISARQFLVLHHAVKRDLYRGQLWNPSYYVGTAGDLSEDTIRGYIERQKAKN